MTIKRRGSDKYHGAASVVLKDANVVWDPQTKRIVFKQTYIPDFGTSQSHHDYTVSVSLDEFARMLSAVSGGSAAAELVAEALKGSVRELTRLTAMASGLSVS